MGLVGLFDEADPSLLQMLLAKEEQEGELEKLRTPPPDSGSDNKELQSLQLDNSPTRSEVWIYQYIDESMLPLIH